jgi:hypothetical protein
MRLEIFRPQDFFEFLYQSGFQPSHGTSLQLRYLYPQIRVEAISAPNPNQTYPVCTGGKGVCPPEDCGDPWGFMKARQEYSVWHILERFGSMPEDEDWAEYSEELGELHIQAFGRSLLLRYKAPTSAL